VKVIAVVLRYFSCLYAVLLGLFLTGVSVVLLLSGATNFKFAMLPFWKGNQLLYSLLALGAVSAAAGVLAFVGKLRALLVLATGVLMGLMIYGFFLNKGYVFQGRPEALNILWVTLAGALAFFGSLGQFTKVAKRA
jgi:hypothetical protein